MAETIEIKRADPDDLTVLNDMAQALDTPKLDRYFEDCFVQQGQGKREIFIIFEKNVPAGYVIFNRDPRYSLYKRLQIPEIQDLNVLPSHRKQGLATRLIGYCEDFARVENYEDIGISVGLHSGFGAAQRLYCKLGYIPDGNGVTYDRETVRAGEMRAVDDLLCLMMVKAL